MRRLIVSLAMVSALMSPDLAGAQSPPRDSPGPYVIDLRGATSGIPTAAAFYPELDEGVSIAARGFGFDAGVHVYPLHLGAATIGVGANVIFVRGTAETSEAAVGTIAPQISFNFGTSKGWSYLSVGLGTARVRMERTAPLTTSTSPSTSTSTSASTTTADDPVRDTSSLQSINAGGGARWFLNRTLAVGFDVRMHRIGSGTAGDPGTPTPRTTLVSLSVGLSVRYP